MPASCLAGIADSHKSGFSNAMGWREKLVEARTKNAMTQGTLALRLKVSQPSVGKWESGTTRPSLEQLLKLADILSLSLDWLFDDSRTDAYEDDRDYRRIVTDIGGIAEARDRLIASKRSLKLGSVRNETDMENRPASKPKRDDKRTDAKDTPGRVR